MKRFFASLLTCALLLGLLPTAALAADDVPYLDRHWDESTKQVITEEKYASNPTAVTDGTTTLNGKWYVVNNDVTINRRITVSGDAHLILMDGYTLTASSGISVEDTNSLTIYGQEQETGKLIAQSRPYDNAAIGGTFYRPEREHTCGSITINGGQIEATGANNAVGIGSALSHSGGNITINGGKVTAKGGKWASGIGSSPDNHTVKNFTSITINGGIVIATGSDTGAGIGGGEGKDGSDNRITINGGNITATGGENGGAGIGGGAGSARDGAAGAGGTIIITGGIVCATGGGNGAGIGGGGSAVNGKAGAGGTIIITGGTVNAVGGSGAGIGSGVNRNGDASDSGSFSAGTTGNAIITASSISDDDDTTDWSGVIFEGNSGQVYGNSVILTTDATIPEDMTLNVEEGQTLIIGKDVTLTNNGRITGSGTIIGTVINHGTIEGGITIQDHAHQWDTAQWSSDATHHWHECTVTGCGERSDTGTHTPGDWIVDQAATTTAPGSKHKACTICGYTTQTEAIPPEHSHSYGQAWVSDAAGHWHECSCGDQSGYAAHTPGEWIIDREATSSTPGQQHKECTVCGYTTQTEAIPATGGGSGGGNSGGGGTHTPPTPPTYKPDVSKPSGGGGAAPTVSPSNPKQGDTVTVTPKPDDGYEVDKITVTDKGGNNVPVTKKPNGTYTFTQPGGRVTIEIEYAPIPLTDRPWNNPFTDVSEGDWYYEALRFVQERGLMNGYSDGRFGPNDTLSRAQLAQILFNKEGRPVVVGGDFNDVDSGAWYADAVTWAAANGIVGGYGDGRFGPNDPITREQLAVMLWRYSGSPAATDKERHFNDVDEISPFALEALRWVVENGVLNGYGDGRLGPQGQATRAQVAQMLKNFIENQEETA